MSPKNVRQTVWMAISTLATSVGTFQERLASAAMGLCSLGPKNDIAKQHQEALDSITQDLTKEPAEGNEGKIKATTCKMSDQDAVRIAKEILTLYSELRGGI